MIDHLCKLRRVSVAGTALALAIWPLPALAVPLSAPILAAATTGVTGVPLPPVETLTTLSRLAAADYADGVETLAGPARPNARTLSNLFSVPANAASDAAPLSNMAVAMFQFLASHEIAQTPTNAAEPIPIAILDPADPLLGTGQPNIAMDRAAFTGGTGVGDPREQTNRVTTAFDGSTIYGSSQDRQDLLRTFAGGKMKVGPGGDIPVVGGMAISGDLRANESPSLRALHGLFLREHNRLADEISAACATCDDQQIFETARVIVANMQHKIFYDELLPLFLGAGPLDSFIPDPSVLAGVTNAINEFTTSAGRIGHTQVPDIIMTGAPGTPLTRVALETCFFTVSCLDPATQAERLYGLTQQAGEPVDTVVVDGLRNGQVPAAGAMFPIDLFATNIERSRDHGLTDYETVRSALGFATVELDLLLPAYILEAYEGQPDGIDLIVGLFGEYRDPGAYIGKTARALWALQFRNLEDSRLGFSLTEAQAALEVWLEGVSMAGLLSRDTGYDAMVWGPSPFLAPLSPGPVPVPPALALMVGALAALMRITRRI